jgi:hypothetical protein
MGKTYCHSTACSTLSKPSGRAFSTDSMCGSASSAVPSTTSSTTSPESRKPASCSGPLARVQTAPPMLCPTNCMCRDQRGYPCQSR